MSHQQKQVKYMLQIHNFSVFYVHKKKDILKIVFDKQFSIKKNTDIFFLTPFLSNEIVINVDSLQIQNEKQEFLLQAKGKGIIISVEELIEKSNLYLYLRNLIYRKNIELLKELELNQEIESLVISLEQQNKYYLVDLALDKRDEGLFYALTNEGEIK